MHKVLGADAGPHRLDALDKVGFAEDILRFEKVNDLPQQFVHGGIFGGEPNQSLGEFECLVQILRTFSHGLGVCQVRSCSQGPSINDADSAKKAGVTPASGSGSAALCWRTSWSKQASCAATLIPWP